MPRRSNSHFRTRAGVLRSDSTYSRRRKMHSSIRRRGAAPKFTGPATRVGSATSTIVAKVHQRATPNPTRSGTESKLYLGLKPVGLWQRVAAKMPNSATYNTNTNGYCTSLAGLQSVTSRYGIFGAAHMSYLMANAFANSGKSVGAYTQTIFVKSAFMTQQYLNSTNACVRLELWDVIAKRDGYKDHAGNLLEPVTAMSQGLKDQTASGTGTEYKIVGTRPTQSKLFNDYWKVKRVTYTELAPGQCHYHRVSYKINRPIDDAIVSANSETSLSYKGWTVKTIAIAYGAPIGDNAGGVTTAAVQLDTVGSVSYQFCSIDNSVSYSTSNNGFASTISGPLENIQTAASAVFAAV